MYFKSSYFDIVTSNAIPEWVMFWEFMILYRGRKYGYLDFALKTESWAWYVVPVFATYIHYYLKLIFYEGQILLAVNRLTAGFNPTSYNRIWKTKRIWIIRLIQFSLPVIPITFICFYPKTDIVFVYREDQKALRLIQDDWSTQATSYVDGFASLIACAVCALLYTVTVVKMSKNIKKYGLQNNMVEMKLIFSALTIFVVLIINTIKQCITWYGAAYDEHIMLLSYDLSYPIMDFMYSITPWALIITSTDVRNMVLPWKKEVASAITMSSSSFAAQKTKVTLA
uniref:Serpentine receptor class gamma n=1 Tax=Panagrellus redivivus TaxID=6233 RepID=A0A7E4WBY9_PANRE